MADLIALCKTEWTQTAFSGSALIGCQNEAYELSTVHSALTQPDFLEVLQDVATCKTDFEEIVLGNSQYLACPQSDFKFLTRIELTEKGTDLESYHFDQLWLLIFAIGFLVAFGLGAIKGGQR